MCRFIYNYFGDSMKIYLDLVLLLNFCLDFILLMSVSYILRRNISIKKLILGALVGAFSILGLFFKLNSIEILIYKIISSILMIITSFKYRNLKYTIKNLIYLYILSFVLGGCLYFLNDQLAYKNIGIMFYHKKVNINYIFILVVGIVIYYLYLKQLKELKLVYSNYQNVMIIFKNNIINCTGFVDSGNKLIDPVSNCKIILLDKRQIIFDINNFKMNLVPYKTASSKSILKCIKPDKIFINNKLVSNKYLVGIMENKINIDGVDILLNQEIMEEINV